MAKQAKKKTETPKAEPFKMYYRMSGGYEYRVWRSDWENTDFFEVMGPDNFTIVQEFCKRFAIPLILRDGDD